MSPRLTYEIKVASRYLSLAIKIFYIVSKVIGNSQSQIVSDRSHVFLMNILAYVNIYQHESRREVRDREVGGWAGGGELFSQ